MKRALILACAFLMAGTSLYAQGPLLELLRADLKAEKVAIVTLNMELTDAQARIFWPIYRKYESELAALNDQRIALIKSFAENYDTMTDPKADALTKQAFAHFGRRLKLQEKTYRELAKALNPVLAAKFIQIDRQLNAVIDVQIFSELPLITK